MSRPISPESNAESSLSPPQEKKGLKTRGNIVVLQLNDADLDMGVHHPFDARKARRNGAQLKGSEKH